ncbi:hypothetical protein K0A96_00255 [Patescibacteria group bacterium]|nr:hypothetical protein [Patescibacteria group bacterium]
MSESGSRVIDLSSVPYPLDLLSVVAEGFDTVQIKSLKDKRFEITGDPDEVHHVINEVSLQAGII